MNKKGFTFVELLAVIVVLALILIISVTKGFGAFGSTKNSINEQNRKAIEEAAKVLLLEIENCSMETEDYVELAQYFSGIGTVSTCDDLKQELSTKKSVNIENFKRDYLSNKSLDSNIVIVISYDLTTDTAKLDDYYASSIPSTYISSNVGVNSSTAITTFTFKTKEAGKISFDWKVSSESGYDKLNVTLNGTSIVSNKSGIQSSSYNATLAANTNYTLIFKYTKDSSVNSGEDKATITNLRINATLSDEINVKNDTYYFVGS